MDIGKLLNKIMSTIDVVGGAVKNTLGELNLKDILGQDIKQEDLAKLRGFLDRYNH